MTAYASLEDREFASESKGRAPIHHQHEVGTCYFDLVNVAVDRDASTLTITGSSEESPLG